MKNGLTFDIEDWFQVENLRSVCRVDRWDFFESRVERNTDLIIDILNQYGLKATFFVLGWIAERHPALIRRIASFGHEIASHGYGHELIYKLSPLSFRNDIIRSKMLLEDLIGAPVIGYRAPNFSITDKCLWAFDVIEEVGFRYDSSIFPTSFHDRYGRNTLMVPHSIKEFYLTTFPMFGKKFPLAGGGYFRLIPYGMWEMMTEILNRRGEPLIFYLHPWELDPAMPRVKVKNFSFGFRHYFNLASTRGKLVKLLNKFSFQPLRDFL